MFGTLTPTRAQLTQHQRMLLEGGGACKYDSLFLVSLFSIGVLVNKIPEQHDVVKLSIEDALTLRL